MSSRAFFKNFPKKGRFEDQRIQPLPGDESPGCFLTPLRGYDLSGLNGNCPLYHGHFHGNYGKRVFAGMERSECLKIGCMKIHGKLESSL